MIEVVTNLRLLAGVMFWGMADLVLGALWVGIILGLVVMIVKGAKDE